MKKFLIKFLHAIGLTNLTDEDVNRSEKFKMYILAKGSIPLGFAMVSATHASLAIYLKYVDDPDMMEWLEKSFRKVVCKVSDEDFERAKAVEKNVIITESNLDSKELAIGFCPRARDKWPQWFRQLPLYSK